MMQAELSILEKYRAGFIEEAYDIIFANDHLRRFIEEDDLTAPQVVEFLAKLYGADA